MGYVTALRNVVVSIVVTYLVVLQTENVFSRSVEADDFRATIWNPARSVLDGVTPYPDPTQPGFLAQSVYPPLIFLLALMLVPLGFLAASVMWTLILGISAVATLVVLGVRDWRLYVLYVMSCPIVFGLLWGNVTVLVSFLVALFWKYRNHTWTGIFLGLAIAVKIMVVPLVIWLLMTGRYRTAVCSAGTGVLLIIVPWATLGFDGLTRYPQTLSVPTQTHGSLGASVQPLFRQLGYDRPIALAAGVVLGGCCLMVAWLARDELASFAWVLASALAFAPVVWLHYYALLAVPLAVARPRLGGAWWLYLCFWIGWVYSPLPWASGKLSIVVIGIATFLLLSIHKREASSDASTRQTGATEIDSSASFANFGRLYGDGERPTRTNFLRAGKLIALTKTRDTRAGSPIRSPADA